MNHSHTPIEKKTLTDHLRTRTVFIIDPIATFLARFRFSPNVITILGFVSHFLFAWLVIQGQMQWTAVFMMLLAPLDALDGALARKTGQKSYFGAFLDSTSDRLAEIVLFAGLLFYFRQQDDGLFIMLSYAAITGSLMVSYTRTRAEALGFSCKVGLLSRVERYVIMIFFLLLDLPHIALIILALFTYITMLQRVFHVWQQAKDERQNEQQTT